MYLKVSIAVLFLVCSVLAGEVAPPQCPPNEIYDTCGKCDAGCKEPKPICPKDICRKGCFCKDDLVRDNDSKCIPREHCPRACGDSEVFKTCGTCDKSCKQPNPICTEECKVGCFCIDGYYRNDTKHCVPFDKCPSNCQDGEIFTDCGTCDPTCAEPGPICTQHCRVGCYCKPNYRRNSEGRCIPEEKCPRQCKSGEVYSECGGCDGTCDQPSVPCARICRVGCFCQKDHVRNKAGECIPVDKCPRKCKSGELYSECGGCDGTCENPQPICTLQCRIGCFCKKGYVRNSAGRCIPAGKCPRRCKCGEVWKDCGTCDRTCKNPNPICSQVCRPGCYCKDGLFRNNRDRCVPRKQCCT